MNKEFSEGFLHDMADLMDLCVKNETDTTSLMFDFNGTLLNVDITFSIVENQND